MTNTYSAVFEQDGEWWIGTVEELPGALAQERTLDEARVSLRQAVADIIQTNREMSVSDGNTAHGSPSDREPNNAC